MISNDQKLKAAQEQIAYFEQLIAQFRVTTSPDEFKLMAGSYLAEIERMHGEVMEYLNSHSSEPVTIEAP